MNTAPSPFRAHSDVLDAPLPLDDSAALLRLLEECKRRAKGAVQAGQWPDANALYLKALECCQDDSSQKAILHANIALCCGKMGKWQESVEQATKATTSDESYVKGFWRLGQAQAALKEYDNAVKAMKKALVLEPTNKALQKELKSLQQKQEKAKEEKEKENQQKKETTTTETTRIQVDDSKEDGNDKKQEKTTTKMDVDTTDTDTTFSKSEHVKGYKIVNGKKTSYFHNEQTEEVKALIGDIRPQKLDTTAAAAASNTENTNKDASAWNKAGTWEERDCTAWATESMQQILKEQAVFTMPASSPAPGATINTTKATVTGHASVATVRGKKRYIYELVVKLEWEFNDDGNHGHDAKGTIDFPDVDGTHEAGDEYDAVNFTVTHASDASLTPLLQQWVHRQGWRTAVHAALDAWVTRFQQEY